MNKDSTVRTPHFTQPKVERDEIESEGKRDQEVMSGWMKGPMF